MSFIASAPLVEHHLPIPAFTFGIVAAVVFFALGIVLWAYKDVANRHAAPRDPQATQHATATGSESHGGGHGHH